MTSEQLDFYAEQHDALMTSKMREAVIALRHGQAVMLVDADDREDEGDLVFAAEKINESSMNFLIQHGSGIVCLALEEAFKNKLNLVPMTAHNTNLFNTNFMVSIEARLGVSSGVSARDRAHTVLTAVADKSGPHDLVRPGHIFPLISHPLGLFERQGHTEASVDLLSIAGLKKAAVLCDLINSDGSMMRKQQREDFATRFNIRYLDIKDILFYKIKTENIFKKTTKQVANFTWYSFNFLEKSTINIFLRAPQSETKTQRLFIISNENLEERFYNYALDNSTHDIFTDSLTSLKNNLCDIIAVISDMSIQNQAFLCRALRDLNTMSIINARGPKEFLALANQYFGFTFE